MIEPIEDRRQYQEVMKRGQGAAADYNRPRCTARK
jgi:hypothetical protein